MDIERTYFYDELLSQFDNIVNGIKSRFNINEKSLNDVNEERQRLTSYEEIQSLIMNYHKELEAICADGSQGNYIKDKANKEQILEIGDNDLREHLLLEETKRNLEEATRNISDAHTQLINQSSRLRELDHHLDKGEKDVAHSNTHLRQLSNRKFCIKLTLHLIVILLAIGIIAGLILKVFKMHNSYSKGQTIEVINQFEL